MSTIVIQSCSTNSSNNMQEHKFTNRLIDEQSPYLLQHAHNPVDWYPWGDEAFEEAKKQDKPIFLSIGYSTCHWCHVMEHESFEDTSVAHLMNETFINIKVDREERPDIDNIYMTVCQMLTGSGGWPLTIIMTPDKKPFYAATYIPKSNKYGRPGMLEIIPALKMEWLNRRSEIEQSAGRIHQGLQQVVKTEASGLPSDSVFEKAMESFTKMFDAQHGGFGEAPKFPSPQNLILQLRYAQVSGEMSHANRAMTTLSKMYRGGIFDQVGFGFHRYATDNEWLLPHFEKMLYDQAMLLWAFAEAFQLKSDKEFKNAAVQIVEYLQRDMTDSQGGFYSAEDADSDGEEGKFYVWETEELEEIVGKENAEKFFSLWNFNSDGNFRDESTGELSGKNIPHLGASLKNELERVGLSSTDYEALRKKLFDYREDRIHPFKDDKILTNWNGLMISALAKASVAFSSDEMAELAKNAAQFVLSEMKTNEGELLHRYRAGQKAIQGNLEDYSFLIQGLLDLYEATFDVTYLREAILLQDVQDSLFWDIKDGSYFFSPENGEELLVRQKDGYDGATPSGNSTSMNNLVRLAKVTAQSSYDEKAQILASHYGEPLSKSPISYSHFLNAWLMAKEESAEIVIAAESKQEAEPYLEIINEHYYPNKVVMLNTGGLEQNLAPFLKNQGMIGGKPTVYLCRNYACQQPINSIDDFEKAYLDFIK